MPPTPPLAPCAMRFNACFKPERNSSSAGAVRDALQRLFQAREELLLLRQPSELARGADDREPEAAHVVLERPELHGERSCFRPCLVDAVQVGPGRDLFWALVMTMVSLCVRCFSVCVERGLVLLHTTTLWLRRPTIERNKSKQMGARAFCRRRGAAPRFSLLFFFARLSRATARPRAHRPPYSLHPPPPPPTPLTLPAAAPAAWPAPRLR